MLLYQGAACHVSLRLNCIYLNSYCKTDNTLVPSPAPPLSHEIGQMA